MHLIICEIPTFDIWHDIYHVYVWFCQHQRWEGVWTVNSPFLVQRYILEELSVAPSIPVISYIKVSDASFTKFSLISPSAHTECQKSKLCSLISHHLAQHCITLHHIALLYTTSHPTAPHTASTSHCTATHGKVCRICTIVTTVCWWADQMHQEINIRYQQQQQSRQ